MHTKKRLMETLKIEKWKAEILQKSILRHEHGGKFALLMKYKCEWEHWREMKWINDDFKNKHVLNVRTTSSYSTGEKWQGRQHKVCVDWWQDDVVPGISAPNKYRCHTPILYPELQLTIISVVD